MIKVENLKKNFGALQVLDGISFELEKGKVLAVVGPSGTGKSTFFKYLAIQDEWFTDDVKRLCYAV